MPGLERGLAYVGIWLACSSIVLDAINPQDSVSEFSSHRRNDSATGARGLLVSIRHLPGSGNSSNGQDQHHPIFINIGHGNINQVYGNVGTEKNETKMSRSPPKIEDQSNNDRAIVNGFKEESSNFIDRLEELSNQSNTTTQELRSAFQQISARIASIDGSLAEIAELTSKTLGRSEETLSACNSTRTQPNETESSSPCPYSTNGSSANGSKLLPIDCWEIYHSGCYVSGIYKIRPRMSYVDAFSVYCEMDARGGGWTVLQFRKDGLLSFYQKWYRYKNGFGSLDGEFWLGLEHMYRMTNSNRYELLVELEDFDGETRYAVYDNFVVSSEKERYALQKLGGYTGTAGDSLTWHVGSDFSTWDRDNDRKPGENCAMSHGGGWWMVYCAVSTLNGHYLEGKFTLDYLRAGIEWNAWRGRGYSYKKSRMSIRPLYR